VAIVGGRVVPIEGEPVEGGTVVLRDGKIAAIEGPGFAVPDGADVVDATGKWVLPGFIDAHAHTGVSEEAEGWAGQDTNERTNPVTAQVRALDAINPADLGFRDAITGGVLAVNVNPGSANPIGGQTVAIKCWGRTVDEMVLREPAGLKSALGENPKRVYGERNETPSTRLGTAAVIRGAFVDALNYQAKLAAAERAPDSEPRVSELCGEGVAGPGVVGDLSGWGLAWPYGRKSGGEELAAEPGEHVGGAGLGLGGVPRA
jgi:imidazolonepropionase-like amidohydrolase